MNKKTVLALLFYFLIAAPFSYALDWRLLHEQADWTDLAPAEEAVKRNPLSISDLYIFGLVCLNRHQDRQAGEAFEKILDLDPQAREAEWGKAEVLRRKHAIGKSEKVLERIIKSDTDFAPAYISLAYIKYTQMDFNRAAALADHVIEQGRQNVDLSNYVRALLIYSGVKGMIAHYGGPISKIINGTAVFPALKKAEKLKPDDAGVLFGLGSFYLLAPKLAGGDVDRAEGYLGKAIKADPQFADAYVRLAQYYQAKGDKGKFNFYLNRALEIDPQNDLALDVKNKTCKFICLPKKGSANPSF